MGGLKREMIKRIWKKIKEGKMKKTQTRMKGKERKRLRRGRVKKSLLMVAGDKRGEGG